MECSRVTRSGILPSVPDINCHQETLRLASQSHFYTHTKSSFASDRRWQVVHYELLPTDQTMTADLDGRHCAIHITLQSSSQQIPFYSLDKPFCGKSFANEADLRQTLRLFGDKTPDFSHQGALCRWRHVGKRFWMPISITLGTSGMKYLLYTVILINQRRQGLFSLPCIIILTYKTYSALLFRMS